MKSLKVSLKSTQQLKTKFLLASGLLLANMQSMIAQSTEVVTKITEWKDSIKTVLDAGVAVFAIVGGFVIFMQYMQGNDQAQKNFIKFIIGLAIFALIDLIVKIFI